MSVPTPDPRRVHLRAVPDDTPTDPTVGDPIGADLIEGPPSTDPPVPTWGTPPADPIEGRPVDPEDDPAPVDAPVDRAPIVGTVLSSRDADRRPILPAWVRDRAELHATSQWALGHLWYTTRYHAVRLPLYAARVAMRAPVGALRVLAWVTAWAADLEGRPIRLDAARRGDAKDYMKLVHHRDERVRLRLLVILAGVLAGILGLLVVAALPRLVTGAVGVLGLARAGSGRDAPLTSRAVVGTEAPGSRPM